jgi:hypothetical protein
MMRPRWVREETDMRQALLGMALLAGALAAWAAGSAGPWPGYSGRQTPLVAGMSGGDVMALNRARMERGQAGAIAGGANYGAQNYNTGGYGTPNNGTPNYNTGGYGTPNYGTPNYNTGGYGTPNYGTPNYNTGGYGTPNYGTPNY